MNAYNKLVSFANENNLKLWSKEDIPELGNIIYVTELNRICASLYNHGLDDIKTIDSIKYDFIIGNQNVYIREHFIMGSNVKTYNDKTEMLNLFIREFKLNKNTCEIRDVTITKWIKCWKLIYDFIKQNIDANNVGLLFETELFNNSINNSLENKLLNNGLKKINLILKHPKYKGEYDIKLFLNLNKSNEEDFYFDFNLSVKYTEGNSDYGYKFYYSKNYPEKYTYPCSPEAFTNFFELNLKNYTKIESLTYGDNSYEQPFSLDYV